LKKKTDDPKYYKYHRIINYPVEKCKALKGQVLQLTKEGNITLVEEETEESDWPFIKIILENALEEG